MFRVKESIHINAPLERCFLLSTSIPLVQRTLRMKPVAGKTTGLVVKGDIVRWRGWKFGLPQMHETLISEYKRPDFFQDTMRRGRFKRFFHDHNLRTVHGRTLAYDVVSFSMHFGLAGKLVANQIVVPHVLSLLQERLSLLKRVAESEEWKLYLEPEAEPEVDLGFDLGRERAAG